MSIINNGLLLASGADAATGYQISRSLRFNSADSAYLSRTPGSAGNRKTWTWSGWIKRCALGTEQAIFTAWTDDTNRTIIRFNSSDAIQFLYQSGGTFYGLTTNQVFRDVSAWYHLVFTLDTSDATSTNRAKIYVNGSQISDANLTAFSSGKYPPQNTDYQINSTSQHLIGARTETGSLTNTYGNFYLADIYLLDGTATTPSTFAETDAITGQWVPKTPTGISYGTNGFRLTFSDNSGTTSTTLGKDAAGSNNWTPNNFSVASGSGNDSLVDSPTSYGTDTGAGGEVRGNYCVCNPLLAKSNETYSNGNLDVSVGAPGPGRVWGTIGVSSGKWYFEHTQTSGTYTQAVGIKSNFVYNDASNNYMYWGYNGNKVNASGVDSSYGASWGNNDVIGVAFDLDAGTITFYKNGVSQGQAFSGITAGTYFPVFMQYSGGSCNFNMNFGQRQWAYAPPSGYKALCDTNLTAPTIAKPANYFDAKLYTGNGSGQTLSGLAFGPDLVWIKNRVDAEVHGLFDQVRGADLWLSSNLTDAETNYGGGFGVTAFTSSGFTVGTGTAINGNNEAHVAWAWDAASSNSTNTSGTITSTVRANATAGFSVVSWTSDGAASVKTVGHGLNVAPQMIIFKNRDAVDNWVVIGHPAFTNLARDYLNLNTTGAKSTSGSDIFSAPTSTLFGIRQSTFASNGNNMIAYCFAPVAGYSAFGSYTGNGSSDGPFVFCNFRPRYLMVKASSTGGSYYYWYVFDSVRDTANPTDLMLFPNVSDAESSTYDFDFLANGFKVRTNAIYVNNSAVTYIYAAFAENPFQYARAK